MAGKKSVPLPIRWREAVTEHPEIDSVEWAVAMALSMRMDNKSGECYPGFASLGRVTRLSRTSVKKAIKGLESKGLIRVRRRRIARDYNDTNLYTAVLPRAQGDLPRAQSHTEVGRRATPVSSETQGNGQSVPAGQPETEAVPGAGRVEPSARLERKPEPLPARLRNLPPDHPAVVEHHAKESQRISAETERLFGEGSTSDQRDKEVPRG
jgi:helix-turn-helix protein